MRDLPKKDYGLVSLDQFKSLVQALPKIRAESAELEKELSAKPEALKSFFGDESASWAEIYEFPFVEQMAILFVLVGMHEPILAAWKKADPLGEYAKWGQEGSEFDQWCEANVGNVNRKHLLWMAIVLQRNILAIMLHHCSMGHLIERARDGDDRSLFLAVQIDRSVLSGPTGADRVARAEARNDKDFFRHLISAIKGPSKKHMVAIQDLRYSIVALRELGFDRFSDEDLVALFIQTRVYSDHPGALKALRKHIQLARKMQPPEMAFSGGRNREA